MARFYTVKVVDDKLERLPVRVDDVVEDALDAAVLSAIEAADPVTRVKSGDLRGKKEVKESKGERTLRWTVDYAAYQDQGTVYISGTNFTGAGAKAGTRTLAREMSNLRIG